jgi:hypothetical protein
MLEKLLPRLEKVHRAQTRKELEAIYRFRYTIYAEELGREIGGVDHKNRMVRDAEDDKDYSIHLYVGTPDEIMGVLRVRFWKPGGIPDYDMSALSLNLFPDIDKLAVAEMGRLMVKRTMRGCFILPSLALETYHILVGEKNVDFVFLYCRPGLVRHYRRLGARPYVGDLVSAPEGMEVPMVVVPFDEKYFKKIGSPLRPLVKKYYGPGKRHPIDLDPYQHLFDDDLLPVEFETEKVWEQFEQEFIREQGKAAALSFLNALPRKHLKKLTDKGFIMQVAAGTLITREEHVEKEMFIILDGIFEVFMRERRVGILEKGDLFGEVAFFRASGKRSATVKALTTGRLLVLRRKFLKEMAKRDPDTAFNILFNLGSMLSERFVAIRSLIV